MTTVTITLTHVCTGGNHLRFGISVDGGAQHIINTDTLNIQDTITDEEKEAFIKICAKLYKQGRTWNQVKTSFQSGVAVAL